MLSFLRWFFGLSHPNDPLPDGDGFGQTMGEDAQFLLRFHKLKKVPIAWRQPTSYEINAIHADPILSRFGDFIYAVADHNGLFLVVKERAWFGWPDPPLYALLGREADQITIAADFNNWPRRWQQPPPPTAEPVLA